MCLVQQHLFGAMATECTDSVYLLCNSNGSDCKCNDSVQLVRDHNRSLRLMAIEDNDSSHSIDSFQNGAKQNARHAGCYCDVSRRRRLETDTLSPFLDFSRLEHAQVAHEHTENPTTQLGRVPFVDAKRLLNFYLILGG